MRKLRWLAAGAALLIAAGTVAGCSSSDDKDDKKALTVWMMGQADPVRTAQLEKVKAEFNAKHPDVTVNVRYVPWQESTKTFQDALSSGKGPDVTEVGNTDVQSWAGQDAFADITDKVNASAEGKDIVASMLANDQLNGKTYAVPWYAGTRAVLYRTDWFKELNIETPKTWAELVAAAKKVQEAKSTDNKPVSGLDVAGDYNYALFPFVWGSGGEVATKGADGKWKSGLESDAAKKGIKFYGDLVATEKVSPEKSISWDELEPQKQFALGNTGMIIGGNWAAPEIDKQAPGIMKNIGAFPIPSENGNGVMPGFAGGSDVAVWNDSNNKDLAWDYTSILTSKKNSKEYADKLKFLPAYKDLLEAADYKADPFMSAFATQMTSTKMAPLSPKWATVDDQSVIQKMVQDVMKGKSVDAAAKTASEQMEKILNS